MLPLEILLSFVSSMTDRLEQGSDSSPKVCLHIYSTRRADTLKNTSAAETLTSRKSRKDLLLTGTAIFNAKPKQGLAFLEKNGIISVDQAGADSEAEKRTKATARFLRHSTRLDKKLLGEYISRPDQIELLKAFIGLFDFRGVCSTARWSTIRAYGRSEIDCRCYAGIIGNIQIARRSSTHISDHRDVR